MNAFDWALGLLYVAFFYLLANNTVKKNSRNSIYKRYYLKGLHLKFIGTFSFVLIYLFYYDGGDSINFFHTIEPTFGLFFSDPASFFSFTLSPNSSYPYQCFQWANAHGVGYLCRGSASLTTIKIGALLNLLCFNSYFALCAFFAYLSYQFQWMTFRLLAGIYPLLHKQFSYAFLMIPSVVFWGSALGKDSITLSCILAMFYSFYTAFILNKNILSNIFVLVLASFFVSLIRGFILFTTLPCLILMAVTYYRTVIRSSILRFLIGPILLAVGVATSILFVRSMGEMVESYDLDSLQQKAEGFRSWHTTQGGSTYSIAENMQYTPMGILKNAPAAMIVTLFGPFFWQIRSPMMLLSGIESFIFLYLFVTRVFFNRKVYKLLAVLMKDHLLVFCIPFIFILGTAIGLTSFNYGALVRYRIPILPFFATAFILINQHLSSHVAIQKSRKQIKRPFLH